MEQKLKKKNIIFKAVDEINDQVIYKGRAILLDRKYIDDIVILEKKVWNKFGDLYDKVFSRSNWRIGCHAEGRGSHLVSSF